jgi:hypothetical protein
VTGANLADAGYDHHRSVGETRHRLAPLMARAR